MLAIKGYYDGTSFQLLENVQVNKNQKVIITVLDEYIGNKKNIPQTSALGMLSDYANPALIIQEKSAWDQAMALKHENI